MRNQIQSAALVLLLAASALLPGCGSGSSSNIPTSNANFTIAITPSSANVVIGGVRVYTAVARDTFGDVLTGIFFSWHSSNSTIAVSRGGGAFKGISQGSVIITATASFSSNSGHTLTTVTSNQASLAVENSTQGTAAEGAPIAAAAVSLMDAHGQMTAGSTDASGHFSIALDGLTGPYLLKVTDARGRELYGVADAAGTANIDPYTDLLVRDWYALHGLDVASAFAAKSPTPASAEMADLDQALSASLADALQEVGVDATHFSLISTPFAADNSGFDRVLDESQVDAVAQRFVVQTAAGPETTHLSLDTARHRLDLSTQQAGTAVSTRRSVDLP